MTQARNPRQYTGVRPINPPNVIYADRNPLNTDKAYVKGDLWLNVSGLSCWQFSGSQWIPLSGGSGSMSSLSAEGGSFTAPLGGNFDFAGAMADGAVADGAILFSTPGDGRMNAVVQTDGVSIEINSSNELQVIGTFSGTGTTVGNVTADIITIPMGATPGVRQFDIQVVGFDDSTPCGAGYAVTASARTTGAAAVLCGTPDTIDNEEAPFIATGDATLVVSGNNAIVQVNGVAGLTIRWRALVKSIFVV